MKSEDIINIAILAEEPIGWGSGKHYFPLILDGYQWMVDDKKYRFSTTYIYDRDIIEGKLKVSEYKVLLVPGGGVGDGESIVKGFTFLPSVKKWKKQIKRYIESGGSYVGICGGTALLTGLNTGRDKKPTTFLERLYAKSGIDVTSVDSYYEHLAFPLFYPFQKKYPEYIGATGYVFSFAPGITIDGTYIHTGGIPVDFRISKDNPIFRDYKSDTIRMRWWGGPGLVLPSQLEREIKTIAWYPDIDISRNPKTAIKAWRYTGGIIGLIKSLFESASLIKKTGESLSELLLYTYYLARPWEKTDRNIILNFSGKPSMTMEVYPNKNKGRILLCTAHPEYMIWWNGFIEEMKETGDNCLAEGFHRWRDIAPLSKSAIEEITYTWWVVRRIVAWAAKIPDEHMPPIEKWRYDEDRAKKLYENIFWDGSLRNQMKNI